MLNKILKNSKNRVKSYVESLANSSNILIFIFTRVRELFMIQTISSASSDIQIDKSLLNFKLYGQFKRQIGKVSYKDHFSKIRAESTKTYKDRVEGLSTALVLLFFVRSFYSLISNLFSLNNEYISL